MNGAMRGNRAVRRLALAAIAAIMTFGWVGHDANAQSGRYLTFLTGGQEVPPVQTLAFSIASFQFVFGDAALVGIRYNYFHDQDVTDIHIHRAPFGEDGEIVLQMRPTLPAEGFCVDLPGGLITYYLLTKEALRGSLAGKTLTDLRALMDTGETYFNLHTPENMGGWIRGQMIPLP